MAHSAEIIDFAAVRSARLATEMRKVEQFLELYGILKEGWRRARLSPPPVERQEEQEEVWSGLEPLPA